MGFTEYHPFVSADAKAEYLKMYNHKAESWPVPSETMLVETAYGQTFVRISGPAGAPPLVLLAGMGGNSLFWMAQVKAWSESYRLYAVDDIYGYSRSVHTKVIDSIDGYVSWLDELLDRLQIEQVNLVGKSYGGWQVGQYALRKPGRVRKAVLLAPGATVLPVKPEIYIRMAREFSSPGDLIFWMYEDFARKDEASRRALEELAEESAIAGRCFNFKPMLAPSVMDDQELQSLKIPVLFLFGENEKLYSASEAVARLSRVAPQTKAEIIPGAGHDLNMVQAEMVNGKVLEFLREQ